MLAQLRRHGGVMFGAAVLLLMAAVALLAPWLGTLEPTAIDPTNRNLVPGSASTRRRSRTAPRSPTSTGWAPTRSAATSTAAWSTAPGCR